MIKIKVLFILIIFSLLPFQLCAWKFHFEREGIKVYTQDKPNTSFDAFKGETEFECSPEAIVSIIMDVENYPEWCYKTEAVYLLKEDSKGIYYRYISDTPPIIKNREAYFYSELKESSDTIIITLGNFDPQKEVPSGYIRMPFSDGYWKLIPLGEKKTHVIFYTHADPGGMVPGWLANMAAVEAPFVTLKNLRALLNCN